MHQLDIFYAASFKVSKRDKETRMFYLERTVNEVMSELKHRIYAGQVLTKLQMATER